MDLSSFSNHLSIWLRLVPSGKLNCDVKLNSMNTQRDKHDLLYKLKTLNKFRRTSLRDKDKSK